jgi:hypothetical protein
MLRSLSLYAVALAGFTAASSPADAGAQALEPERREPGGRRMLSVLLGGFTYDRSGDRTFPLAVVRADWALSRHVLSEVGLSFARAEVENFSDVFLTRPAEAREPITVREDSNIFTATVGLQAQLPMRHVRPYVGFATGLFGRMDPPGGDRFVRTTQTFATGVRVPITAVLGARGELRYRLDQHQDGRAAGDFEQTIGLSWSY